MDELKKNVVTEENRLAVSNRVGAISVALNCLLAAVKIFAGIVAHSHAMIADGVHTISDVVSTAAVMIGMVFSTKPDDKDHPYGHEKIEAEVGKLLSMALMATGIGVGWASVNTIINGSYTKPGVLAAIAAVLSIIVKEWMYHYTVRAAKKINSPAMKADAWHHRSDALSSIGTLVGITGAMLGLPILDPLAGLIVCVMIMKVSFSIYVQSLNQLIDKAADDAYVASIRKVIEGIDGVEAIDDIKTRMHGAKYFVDVEIGVDSDITVRQGHDIAQKVHDAIEEKVDSVKHCMVHVNPVDK